VYISIPFSFFMSTKYKHMIIMQLIALVLCICPVKVGRLEYETIIGAVHAQMSASLCLPGY
jgi:hypothetical protein